MAPPAVHQHQRVIGAQAAQRERANNVVRVGHALAREVHRWREVLQDLARFVRALQGDLLRGEHVDRDRELLGGRVPGARPDDDVHGREADRLRREREVLRHRDLPHRHARRLRHVAEQPHADGVRSRGQAADLVAPLLVTCRVQPAALGGDHRPGERCARRIRNAAPNRAILCQQHRRHDAEYREHFLDSSHNHASWESDLFALVLSRGRRTVKRR